MNSAVTIKNAKRSGEDEANIYVRNKNTSSPVKYILPEAKEHNI